MSTGHILRNHALKRNTKIRPNGILSIRDYLRIKNLGGGDPQTCRRVALINLF